MDQESLKTIVIVLATAFVGSGGLLISVVTWIVIQGFRKIEDHANKVEAQFTAFGTQLNQLRELTKDELHALENRIIALETWRAASERPLLPLVAR